MEIKIFDVEHGFCAYLIADNGNTILIDCGHNSTTGFRPSNYLMNTGCTGIERFIVSNYDGDHLSDLPNLYRTIPIQILHRNNTISADELKSLKLRSGPIQSGMQTLLDMINYYNAPVTNPPPYPDLYLETYYNSFPEFNDTNNLSLVTFIKYRDLDIVFPGDLEKAGWEKLLVSINFRNRLSTVNTFVASHHGRENGYCESVFNYCTPDIVVISDGAIKYDTQKNFYQKHSKGIRFPNGEVRYVLTTRCDGCITIRQNQYSTASIHISM
jgi:beta-lactamase superfamily II metal-dependent hydrolase